MCPLSWTLDDINRQWAELNNQAVTKYQNEMANFRQQIEETIEAHPTDLDDERAQSGRRMEECCRKS